MAMESGKSGQADYKSLFGLSDNPFNPRSFGEVDPRLLDRIWVVPLQLDRDLRLSPLFVTGAGPFQKAVNLFEEKLRSGGYSADPRALGSKSLVFRIVGPEGSGKSTLVNLLVGRLKQCASDGRLLVTSESIKQPTLDAALERIRQQVGEFGGEVCCLVFENAGKSSKEQLYELFLELQQRRPVVMFEVVHHAEEVLRPSLASTDGAHMIRTGWLTPEEAIAFLDARIALFRVEAGGAEFVGDVKSFPFSAEEVRNLVGEKTNSPAVTLRVLNWVFNEAIEREVARRGEAEAIGGLSAGELASRTISASEIYREMLAEALGEAA